MLLILLLSTIEASSLFNLSTIPPFIPCSCITQNGSLKMINCIQRGSQKYFPNCCPVQGSLAFPLHCDSCEESGVLWKIKCFVLKCPLHSSPLRGGILSEVSWKCYWLAWCDGMYSGTQVLTTLCPHTTWYSVLWTVNNTNTVILVDGGWGMAR